jgi:integrase
MPAISQGGRECSAEIFRDDSMPNSPACLPGLLSEYLGEREASPRYAESLRRTVRKCVMYGLRMTSQLDPASVNDFLRSLDLSPVTRANIRREILTLWRYAYEQGHTEEMPRRVMRIKAPRRPVEAWTAAELNDLLDAAESDARPVSRLCPRVFWRDVLPVWIAVGYDSGLRFSDILQLRDTHFIKDCVAVNAAKTGKSTVRRLSPYTLASVQRLLAESPDGSLFQWCITRKRALTKWREFLKEQNMRGSSRWLRRSAATFVELEGPGSASVFLSHSNPALARLHYLDQTLMGVPKGPPKLR